MSRQKLRVVNTELDNLVSNLRGEVGEVIASWILLRYILAQERKFAGQRASQNLTDQNRVFWAVLADRLEDDIASRLSELGEAKIGRLTFHFAATKLAWTKKADLSRSVQKFSAFISRERFQEKRNYSISHKELPERWSDHKVIHIRYRTILKAISLALRLMKAIDNAVVGPAAKYLWKEMRKKRYVLMNPPSAAYMLLPYLNLSGETRSRIVLEEMAAGRQVWSEMPTTVNGQPMVVPVNREWGVIALGERILPLDGYPLRELKSIELRIPQQGIKSEGGREPIFKAVSITAKYRAVSNDGSRLSFAPVQPYYHWREGAITELPNINVNLSDKLRSDFGEVKIGDEKEFTMNVTVQTGYRESPH